MIEDIQIHESIDLSILELKEVTERDRAKGTKADTFKVIYTFYSIIVLLISLVPRPPSSFIVYHLSFIVGSTVYNTCTAARTRLHYRRCFCCSFSFTFSETIFMFVFCSGWVGNSNSNGYDLHARSQPHFPTY